ncbi:hypothetical protein BUALT_Bualt05G0077300 [Buddleja alternifolia]|uniref:Uncharacterized protein n=1 Tax=Buddleja alternifolia TaxID=168488 RepID=A0AAV6XJC5_9LAMI|nr:hypothetical protein BUALT_Bualt05G0077300 [Buddleja alternifolia]
MTRRCSHCSHNGHNSRTCPNRGVKIFGVRLTDGSIRKSASMGNLSHYMGAASGTPQNGGGGDDTPPDHPSAAADGTPWTEEEHRMFLLGLQKLGKGDWRGIARNYVISRTPTQVASHAQKYFIRQSNMSRRKRRSSLFDIVADESVDTPLVSTDFYSANAAPLTETQVLAPAVVDEESPPFFPLSIPFWAGGGGYNAEEPLKEETHQVVKPTAVHSKSPINVDELVGMSKLSLGESLGDSGQSSTLSLELVQGSSARPSAFHANNPPSATSDINSTHN